jgi:hypothetical protein
MLLLKDCEFEYTVEIDTSSPISSINLNRTNIFNEHWSDAGLSYKCKLVDTGDQIILNLGKRTIKLDYSQMEEVYILLRLWKKYFETGPNLPYKLIDMSAIEDFK